MRLRIAPVVLAATLAIPGIALAQSLVSPPGYAPFTPLGISPPGSDATIDSPSSKDGYIKAGKMERARKIVGATVYNDRNEKIGSVNELLIGQNNDIQGIVLLVSETAGVNNRLVEVPAVNIRVLPDRVVMSHASKDELKQLPDFRPRPASAS